MIVNHDDAPEGYIAVKATMLCGGCKFMKKDCVNMPELNCTPSLRKDKQIVIFRKKMDKIRKEKYYTVQEIEFVYQLPTT